MHHSRKIEIIRLLSLLTITTGIIANEWVLTYLFSSDGMLENLSRLIIWLFDLILVGFGLFIYFSDRFRNIFISLISPIFNFFDIKSFQKQSLRNFLSTLTTVVFLIILISQFSYMVTAIYKNQDNLAVLEATNIDAGHAIETTLRTTWYNDNHWYAYGTLYYRIAHSLSFFAPNNNDSVPRLTGTLRPSDWVSISRDSVTKSMHEAYERRTHFALQLISLFSVFGIAFIICSLLFQRTSLRIIALPAIIASSLNIDIWTDYIFRAHPDHLLSFLSSLFLFLVYISVCKKRYQFYLPALIAGLALSTKITFLLFIPGMIFLMIPPLTKKNMLRLVRFYFLLACSYFLIGFPQNFRIGRGVNEWRDLSQWFVFPTWESIAGWCFQLLDQGWQIFLIIPILYCFLGENVNRNSNEGSSRNSHMNLRIFAVALTPFICLLSRSMIWGPGEMPHHTIPFLSIILAAEAIILISTEIRWVTRIRIWMNRVSFKFIMAILFLVIIEIWIGIIPRNVDRRLRDIMSGREAARDTYELLNSYLKDGKKVLVEATIPFNHYDKNITYTGHMHMTINRMKEYDPDIITIPKNQLHIIMEGEKPNDSIIINHKNWKENREFYDLFYNKNETVDPWGMKWIKTYEDLRGVQIWEKR